MTSGPKFKKGDRVIDMFGQIYEIDQVWDLYYLIRNERGRTCWRMSIEHVDQTYDHLKEGGDSHEK